MASFVARKIRAKLSVIAFFENLRRQVPGPCELLDIIAIPFIIPLKLRQREVVRLQCVKSQMGPGSREHGHEPLLVVFGGVAIVTASRYSLCFRCRAVPFPAISIK
jgi:hypothetical protein